jgi:hypothetical protein
MQAVQPQLADHFLRLGLNLLVAHGAVDIDFAGLSQQ